MQKIIIADTSCLILLDKIGELNILKELYREVVVTQEIVNEFNQSLPSWFKVQNPTNKIYQKILEATLDTGESSAIALAIEQPESILILDDDKGRRYAEKLGIKVTGTLGVIISAKQIGRIKSIKNVLEKIKNTNFRLTIELERQMLERAGEL